MPSPESPAKRITAWSITSRFVFPAGTSVSVDIVLLTPVFQRLLQQAGWNVASLDPRFCMFPAGTSPNPQEPAYPEYHRSAAATVDRAALCVTWYSTSA